jgi:PST family polysaccharide transporter
LSKQHLIYLSKFFKKINYGPKKTLLGNFVSLSFLQGANYLLPLITLPYLVRVLGVEKFGLIAFAQAFIWYFIVLTDYGFNLSATREISIHRENRQKVSEIFCCVMLIKLALTVLSFVTLCAVVLNFSKFKSDWQIYFLTYGMVIGQALFPVWFFQGMEKMKYIAFLNITVKSIFIVPIFTLVRSPADYIYVPMVNSVSFLTVGVLSLWIVFRIFGVRFKWPTVVDIEHQFKDGWHIFISTFAANLYTVSNAFILGLFTNNTIVGYYSAAEKLIKAAQGLFVPILHSVYPFISKLANESHQKALHFIRKLIMLVSSGSFIVSLLTFIFAELIINIALGNQYQQSVTILRILAFLPFIIALSNILGIQTMLTFNLKKAFSRILICAGFLNVCLALILAPLYRHIGVSVAALTTETFVTICMYFYLKRKGINVLRQIFSYEGK